MYNKISWEKYIEKRFESPHRPLLEESLQYLKNKKTALDLGAGSMNDSKYLLEQNFEHVIAVDTDEAAVTFAQAITAKQFEFQQESFLNFHYNESYFDLINAQYALPFLSPNQFKEVFPKILLGIKEGGIFCGQFFGNRDTWTHKNDTMNFHTREEITQLFTNLKIIKLEEEENDGVTALGNNKHWHVFHVIAIK